MLKLLWVAVFSLLLVGSCHARDAAMVSLNNITIISSSISRDIQKTPDSKTQFPFRMNIKAMNGLASFFVDDISDTKQNPDSKLLLVGGYINDVYKIKFNFSIVGGYSKEVARFVCTV